MKFKLVGFIALFLALPVVLYQLWAFIVPGLTERERRLAIPFVASSVVAVRARRRVRVLDAAEGPRASCSGFAGSQFAPLLTGDRYLSFVMLVALSFGIAFEFPIVLIFLTMAGVLTTRKLRDWRRGAIVRHRRSSPR